MSDRIIESHQSWDYGRTAGRREALKKMTELHFKAVSNYFVDLLNEIHDDEIIEKLFDSQTFWTNHRTRANLDLVMNSIRGAKDDYKYKLKKDSEERKAKKDEGWDSPVILENFKEMCNIAGNPNTMANILVVNDVSDKVVVRLLKHAGYDNGEEIVNELKERNKC